MIDAVFYWSLKVSIILSILFLAYLMLFRNNTQFQWRRILVLGILILSAIAPYLSYKVTEEEPIIVHEALALKTKLENTATSLRPSQSISKNTDSKTVRANPSIFTRQSFITIYSIGLALFALLLIIEILRLFIWKLMSGRDVILGNNILRHPSVKAPFSYWSWIFIPQFKNYPASTWHIIHQHEKVHIQQKHSIDLMFMRVFQALLWYNPVVYWVLRELKTLHEAQVDHRVLKSVPLESYAETLLKVTLPGFEGGVSHSFARISSLSKRIKLMKTHKTTIRKTILLSLVYGLLAFGCLTWTSLWSQEKQTSFEFDVSADTSASKQTNISNSSLLASLFESGWINKLTAAHERVFLLLKSENPDKKIAYRYFKENNFHPYFESFKPGYNPLFVAKLNEAQQSELIGLLLADTTGITFNSDRTIINKWTYSDLFTEKQLKDQILPNTKYLMIYESTPVSLEYDESSIFSPEEVDVLPQVMGGLENLAKTIALEIKLPEGIDRSRLPKTIDFEFVVQGGQSISHLNLLTEMAGSDKRNRAYYLFFGQVHDTLRSKIASLYSWKRGVKDGKEVLVRMKISIPTRYMM